MSQQMPSYARPLVAYILSLIDKALIVRQLGGHNRIPGGVLGPHHTSHENGGSDELSVAGLSGTLADPQTPAAHVLDGAAHTVSGLTPGDVLKALTAATFGFAQLAHSALASIGANDHHNQQHALVGSDHTAAGLTIGHLLTATGATTFAFQAPVAVVLYSPLVDPAGPDLIYDPSGDVIMAP